VNSCKPFDDAEATVVNNKVAMGTGTETAEFATSTGTGTESAEFATATAETPAYMYRITYFRV